MKIKSLLAAVSMVAITAGSANALEIPASSVVPNGIVPALELALPGTPALTGTFNFSVNTQTGNYPNGNNLVVTINLPAGIVFASNLTGSAVVPAANAQGVVNGGGTAGANTVTLLVSLDDAYNSNMLGVSLPLRLDACPAAGDVVEVLVKTEANTNIEEGRAITSNIIAPCQSAVNGVVTSDEATSDTLITLASGYTLLQEVDPVTGANISAPNTVGAINYSINPAVSKSLAALTPLATTDVDAISFDVVLENAAGITAASVGANNGTASIATKVGNVFRFNITNPTRIAEMLDGTADEIRLVASGGALIPTQTVTVANSSVSFRDTGSPDMIVSEAGATGSLDPLQREGREFGYFDWNAGPAISDPTVSVYRITGLTPNAPVDYSVTLENSNNNGTYAGSITANSYGEAQLVSSTMPVPSTTERFDVLINIETPNTDVDVDRLMLRSGIVTAFNDGANADQEDSREPNLNDSDN